mgnify:CR=1 FL=1
MLKENMPEYDERDEMSEQRAVVNKIATICGFIPSLFGFIPLNV